MPASELPVKPKDIDLDFFNKNIFDTKKEDEITFLGDKPCMVKFYTNWWGPCRTLTPILDELAKDYKGKVDFYKVDIEKHSDMASMFGVMSVPTIVMMSENTKPTQIPGAPHKEYQRVVQLDGIGWQSLLTKMELCFTKVKSNQS